MTDPVHGLLQKQIARVSRRLFLQGFLDSLAWCWLAALLLGSLYLLLEPLVPGRRPDWVSWAVGGGLFALATLLAVAMAFWRTLSRLAAALLLDERFGLKERATTALTLAPEQVALPAAQAVLADAREHVSRLNVGSRFPIRLNWQAGLVPLAGLALALVAAFYDPPRSQAVDPDSEGGALVLANKPELEQKLKEVEKKAAEKRAANRLKGEKADPFDEELQKILNKPRESVEEVRDRIKELTSLEEKVKNQQEALGQKSQALRDQLQQMNRMAGMDTKDGPAKDLQKALEKGDAKKVQEEVERLVKKVKNKELSPEEQKQLEKRVQNLQQKMQRLSRLEEEEQSLKELNRQGKLDKEQLDQALDNLKKMQQQRSGADQKDLEDLAEALKQCSECLSKGDGEGASEALQKAGQAMRRMEDGGEQGLDEQLDMVRQCREGMCRATTSAPVPGQGQRPESKEGEVGYFQSKLKGKPDAKGRQELIGFGPGNSYKSKKTVTELSGEIRQASQEASEAIDRQRIPRAAADMARGYFENFRKLGENSDKDKKK